MSSSERPQHAKQAISCILATLHGRNLAANAEWHEPSPPEVHRETLHLKHRGEKLRVASELCCIEVVCDTENDRGAAVDAIHGCYERVPESHHDDGPDIYADGYRTIRTAVLIDGRPTNVVIRVRKDQELAEGGIPVKWRAGAALERGPWRSPFHNELRGTLACEPDPKTFDEGIQNILSLEDRITVYVDGEPLDVPVGVTALDAAFLSDPERAVECHSVQVDDDDEVFVREDQESLQPLKAGQTVRFLGVADDPPDPNWCRKSSGMLELEGNRALVQQQLARLDPNESVPLGHQELVENPDTASLSEPIDRRETAGLTRSGSVGVSEVGMNEARFEIVETEAIPVEEVIYEPHAPTESANDEEFIRRCLVVIGRPDAEIRFAGCCSVTSVGDDVVPYYRGWEHGIRVHSADCSNVSDLPYPERVLEYEWIDDRPIALAPTGTGGADVTSETRTSRAEKVNLETQAATAKHEKASESANAVELIRRHLFVAARPGAKIHFADCCGVPNIGDAVVAYDQRWNGVWIHRFDCRSVTAFPYPERILQYEWLDQPIADAPIGTGGAEVTFEILTSNYLLTVAKVSRVLEQFGASVIESVKEDIRKTRQSIIRLTVMFKDSELLARLIAEIKRIFGGNSVRTLSMPPLAAA